MSIIGAFAATTDGYVGTIRTLTIHAKLRIVAVDNKAGEDSPDFRILFGLQEVGAAWKAKMSMRGRVLFPVRDRAGTLLA
jgi:uncharacterized protein (DUF736 family)